jgi:RHS repeat-associated protein
MEQASSAFSTGVPASAAIPQLAGNSRQGFGPVLGTMHWASGWVISSNTLGIKGSLYDGDAGSRSTGKERDTESGNDYFGARYFASSMGRFLSPDPIGIMTQKLFDPQQWNGYAYSKNNPLRFMDPSGMYVTTCKDGDKACAKNASDFEKSRQRDLKSKDASVRGAAGAYGDPGKANGVTVTWGNPGKGDAGGTVVTGLHNNGDGTFSAEATVTLRSGQSGAELDATVGHEGQHVEDADGFAATVTPQGFYDLSKNLTSFQTEMNAYRITNSILNSNGVQRSYGSCDSGPCALGVVNPDPTIRQLLANPANGYGVTEANQGARQNPNITTPNPKPQ